MASIGKIVNSLINLVIILCAVNSGLGVCQLLVGIDFTAIWPQLAKNPARCFSR